MTRLLAPLLTLALAAPGFAQETEPAEEVLEPVGVLTFAGVERARGDVDFLFDTVERGDMAEVIDGYLEFVNDLGGVDRTRPFGVMLFLKPGFVPIPSPVGFLPVADLAELRDSLTFGEDLTTEKLTDDLIEIKGRRGTLFGKLSGGYLLISNEREFVEERQLPDPLSLTAPLAARYDFAVQLMPRNIPDGMRTLFQNLLRQNTQTQMQRRDDEPEAAYRSRKSASKRNLEVIEAMLEGSNEITLGLDASAERRTIELELTFEAVEGTAWGEMMASAESRATPFDILHEESRPLSVVAGTTLNEWDVPALIEQLKVGRDEVGAALAGLRPIDGEDPARKAELEAAREAGTSDYELIDPTTKRLVDDVFEPLIVTAENRELDFFLQFERERPGSMTVLGGVRVDQGDRLAAALPQVLERLRGMSPDLDKILTLNVAESDGVTWHRLDFGEGNRASRAERRTAIEADANLDDEQRQRRLDRNARRDDGESFFGGVPSFHVGLGRTAIWIAVGADGSLEQAQEAVATVAAQAGRLGAAPQSPIRMAVNVSGWFSDDLDDLDDGDLRARTAFEDGNDRMTARFDATPTGGGRLRIVFDEGFVKFLALSITDRYDASQL